MRVSFDIDETLVCRHADMRADAGLLPNILQSRITEPLRRGTSTLIRRLRGQGCSVWIYTSSLRSPIHIWLWLRLHGIRIDGIINDDKHRAKLSQLKFSHPLSKYPPAFNIDLHVDNSDGVELEGKTHGFRVL